MFVCILVLHGTYIRARAAEDVPTTDWLVFARLLACAAGFTLGLVMISKVLPLGFGAKILLFFGLATMVSAIGCPYRTTVLGYSGLLVGASVLMIGLTYSARNVTDLRKIENIWFLTVAALVVKDAIVGLATPQMLPGEEVARLGMSVTHPTELSLLAVLVFWLSFTRHPESYSIARWLLRIFLIFVIIAARTRISIMTFVLAGFVRLILLARDPLKRFIVVSATAGALLMFLILNISFSQPWATRTIDYLRRGQTKASLTTLTSRTLIWNHVLPKTFETPIIGHGYGVSRLTMGKPHNAGFQPLHCHNAVLEVFFSTGFLGLFPFMLILIYSLKWIWDYARLRAIFSTDIALHAVCSVVILLGSSFSEAILGVRLSPIQPLFFLYLLALDRKAVLSSVSVHSENRCLPAKQSIPQPLLACR